MLKERKCLMCKHLIRDDDIFNHRCKAYPKGIPAEMLDEDTTHVDCRNKYYHFEEETNRPQQ